MNKYRTKKMTRKILGLALCLIMTAGTSAGVIPAAETAVEKKAAPVPLITCASAGIELVDNDSSVETSLCLKLDDGRIINRIHREDVGLGGVFRGMFVSGIRHDNKTILLDLAGVPDFGRENDIAGLQGTVTFPGEIFGCEDSVITSVDIIEKIGTKEEWKPSFRPYLNAMRDTGDEIEMSIVLIPVVGAFSEDFGIEDIGLARNLKNGRVKAFWEMEEGSRELIVDVPKTGWRKDGGGFSGLGSIILSGGSMADADGTPYEKPVYAVREFSLEKVGRDLTTQDVETIQEIVGGFGNTTTGTVLGLISGGATAGNAAYTMLGWCGVVPNDASRHAEIMKLLGEINNTVNEINSKCDYMSGVLDAHTLMINKMGVKLDEQFLGKYDASFASMVEMMDTLENALQRPVIKAEIEAVVDDLVQKYQISQIKVNRDFDDYDLVFDDLSDFYESDDGFTTEDAAYADWEEEPEIFGQEDGSTDEGFEDAEYVEWEEKPEIFGQEDGSTVEWFEEGADDLDILLAIGGPYEEELYEEEQAEESVTEDGPDSFIMADEEIANADEKEAGLTAEAEQEVVTEAETAADDRILINEEMEQFLMELDSAIGQIHLSANVTVGEILSKIYDKYSDLSKYFNKLDSSNPVKAFCNIHEGVDNFKTTSLKEEMLYEEYLKCQLTRALTLLQSLDSPTMYEDVRDNFNKITWPDVTDDVRDRSGNPYCYLMEGFVRLSTVSEVQNWLEPMRYTKKSSYVDSVQRTSNHGLHVSASEFFRRMHGRSLEAELELAGIKNLSEIRNATWDGKHFGGLTFGMERWGVKYGARKYEKNTFAWTDGVRYKDPIYHYYEIPGDWRMDDDGLSYGGILLATDNDYLIVATQYIRWTDGYGDLPAQIWQYRKEEGTNTIYYPMTSLELQ